MTTSQRQITTLFDTLDQIHSLTTTALSLMRVFEQEDKSEIHAKLLDSLQFTQDEITEWFETHRLQVEVKNA